MNFGLFAVERSYLIAGLCVVNLFLPDVLYDKRRFDLIDDVVLEDDKIGEVELNQNTTRSESWTSNDSGLDTIPLDSLRIKQKQDITPITPEPEEEEDESIPPMGGTPSPDRLPPPPPKLKQRILSSKPKTTTTTPTKKPPTPPPKTTPLTRRQSVTSRGTASSRSKVSPNRQKSTSSLRSELRNISNSTRFSPNRSTRRTSITSPNALSRVRSSGLKMQELKRRSLASNLNSETNLRKEEIKKDRRRRTVGIGKGIITGDESGRVRIRDVLFDSEVDNF